MTLPSLDPAAHRAGCHFRSAINAAELFGECEHGESVCPTCDDCTCPQARPSRTLAQGPAKASAGPLLLATVAALLGLIWMVTK